MKRLFESYKDYFRVGAAISGIILMSDEEKAKHFEHMKARYEDFKKNFKPTPEFPEFKFPEPKPFPAGRMPDYELAASQFNLVVAENECKMGSVYHKGADGKPTFDFAAADRLRDFAKKNGQDMRWHTLVWHNQSPDWIFKNDDGSKASREVLEERLKNYIFTVGERYRDDICSVDVVNECISDKNFVLRDGADRSQWFDILGPDYVDKAFFWAKEAFPKSSLVINDYNLEMVEGKIPRCLLRCPGFAAHVNGDRFQQHGDQRIQGQHRQRNQENEQDHIGGLGKPRPHPALHPVHADAPVNGLLHFNPPLRWGVVEVPSSKFQVLSY